MTMTEYMEVHQERMLKQALIIPTINTKIISDHCKMTISQLKFLQMLTIMVIIPIMTASRLPTIQLTLHGEAPIQMFR